MPGQACRSTSSSSLLVDAAGAELADRLERAHHGQVAAVQVARLDRAAVDEDRRDVHPGDRDHGAGHVLVAAAHGHDAIHALRAAGGLDRIGDHLAGDQGVLHALGAHRDPVAHGDGAEDLGHGAGGPDRGLGAARELIEARVAGRDGAVAVRDADDRLAEVAVAEADRAQHGAVGGALHAGGDRVAAETGRHGGEI